MKKTLDENIKDVDIDVLIKQYQTPFYIYDFSEIDRIIQRFKSSFIEKIKLFYSVKANPNKFLLKLLRPLIDGVDVSSSGELLLALKCGYERKNISFVGPGKTDDELKTAITENIGSISIESLNELLRIERISSSLNTITNISLRINPDFVARGYSMKMGGRASQFGVDVDKIPELINVLKKINNCNLNGLHIYSGTQCLNSEGIIKTNRYIADLFVELINKYSLDVKWLNFGGGFGIPYNDDEEGLDISFLGEQISAVVKEISYNINYDNFVPIIELGRYLVGSSGYFVTKVIDIKESHDKIYYVVDGGLNSNQLISSFTGYFGRNNFKVINICNRKCKKKSKVNIVGHLCTPLDQIAADIYLDAEIGDYLMFYNTGAYAYSASPLNFLSHTLPAEIIINNRKIISADFFADSVYK